MSHRRQAPFALLLIGSFMGLAGFLRMTQRPHFESYRTIDVIQLLTTGASIGVAFTILMVTVLRPWEAKGMPASQREKTSHRRRRPLVLLIFVLLLGLTGFNRVTQSPSFESYRMMDVAQLLAIGFCFGGALTGLMFMVIQPWAAEKVMTQEPSKIS